MLNFGGGARGNFFQVGFIIGPAYFLSSTFLKVESPLCSPVFYHCFFSLPDLLSVCLCSHTRRRDCESFDAIVIIGISISVPQL